MLREDNVFYNLTLLGANLFFSLFIMKKLLQITLMVFLVPSLTGCVKIVDSAQEGVKTSLGKIREDSLGEGVHFYIPIITKIRKIDMRERTVTVDTSTVSKEGLKFGISITVRYRVKPTASPFLVKNLKNELHEFISTFTNSTIDDVATAKDKNAMYSSVGRQEIIKAVKDKLNVELGDYAVISKVILEDITLPSSITDAIQAQQAAEEKIKEEVKLLEVEKVRKDRKIVEAEGIAEANKIINNSLTTKYLQYEAIQKLNPEAQKILIPSSGIVPLIGM